jgi:hypothetical protein
MPVAGAIVARDQFGGFIAGQINATNFVGRGFGLTDIPNSATTATEQSVSGAIVARDAYGNFASNQIYANLVAAGTFVGDGSRLTGVVTQNAQFATEAGNASTLEHHGAGDFAQVYGNNTFTGINDFKGGSIDATEARQTIPARSIGSLETACLAQLELAIYQVPNGHRSYLVICNPDGTGFSYVNENGGSVDTTSDQTIGGVKTFTSEINGSISGNARTVTDGVYTTGAYADPAWITSLSASKITGAVANATNATTATSVSGTVGVANGGTGLTTSGPAGAFLRSNGNTWTQSGIQTSDIPDLSNAYVSVVAAQTIPSAKAFVNSGNAFTGTFTSATTNAAGSGTLRLASGDQITFRNSANADDVSAISKDSSDVVVLGGSAGVKSGGRLNVSEGVVNDGSGMKHRRVTSCTTASSNGSTCDVTVTWTTPFADTNYTPSCSLSAKTSAPVGRPTLVIQAKTAASLTVRITSLTNSQAGGSGAEIACIAIHD